MKHFLVKLVVIFVVIFLGCTNKHKENIKQGIDTKPNIIIIQADDLGYDDLSMHNNPHLETPNLDNLGKQAVQFNQFYLQSVCAPSRASLLTGKNFLETGVTSVHAGRDFMNLKETTIAQIFKANGYKTGMWGKWHSGKTNGYFPWDRGFDEAYYACLYNYWENTGLLNGQHLQTKGFTTDAITDMAINFVKKNKNTPFFAYVSHLAPHNPWRAPQKYVDKYLKKGLSKPMATLYGMIDNLDTNIGRLLKTLDDEGLSKNTIVVFLSDNGPWIKSYRFGLTDDEWQLRNPSGMRGKKGNNWQNGVRSTLFFKWKDKIIPSVSSEVVKIEDILPTLISLTKTKVSSKLKFDGVDVSNVFKGAKLPVNSVYFGSHTISYNQQGKIYNSMTVPLSKSIKSAIHFKDQTLAVRKGNYKYVQNLGSVKKGLFHIKNDAQEKKNLIDSLSKKGLELETELKTWYQNILANEYTYNMPVFQIGYKQRKFNQIYAAAPSYITKGLENKSHYLGKWQNPNDSAAYKINVNTPGNYKVYFIHKIKDYNQFEFSLSTQKNKVSSVLKDSGDRAFGTLLEGESAYWENFDKQETFKKDIIKSEIGNLQLTTEDKELYIRLKNAPKGDNQKGDNQIIAIQLFAVD